MFYVWNEWRSCGLRPDLLVVRIPILNQFLQVSLCHTVVLAIANIKQTFADLADFLKVWRTGVSLWHKEVLEAHLLRLTTSP